jgi:tetratricopeptide (TPR) repeat protein
MKMGTKIMTRQLQSLPGRVMMLIFITCMQSLAVANDDVLQQAKMLVGDGKTTQAYALLEPLEDQRAGDPEFDYLLGVSALESGQAGRAVFALERVLAVNPKHSLARAEIARAYYILGERQTAKQEFQNILQENPPEQVSQAINQYLSAIDRTMTDRTRFSAFIEYTFGHDSNVNNATSNQQVAIPIFGGVPFTLDPLSTKQSDYFSNIAGGISFRHPLAPNVSLFGGLTGNQRINNDTEKYDTQNIDANLGVSIKRNHDIFTLALQNNDFELDSEGYRRAYGIMGQWQHTLDNSNQISAFLQATRLNYKTQSVRDADRYVAGIGYGHAFTGDYLPVLFVSGYTGTEDERASDKPWLGHWLTGARVGGQMTFNPKTVVFGSAAYEYRNYGGKEPFWLVSRDDKQLDLTAGLRYTPSSFWTISPQIGYTHNNSNVIINDYNRFTFSVTMRRDFNW